MRNDQTPTSTRSPRRLRNALLALLLPAAAAPIVAVAPAHAAADCTTDCVNVSVSPGVDRFKFDVTTSTSAKIATRITTKDGNTTIANTSTPGLTTSYSLGVSNLKQGTHYRYDVYGTDASGNTWRETGYFSTLIRHLTVSFNQLKLIDDSDAVGPGELVGGVQLWTPETNSCAMKDLAPLKRNSITSMSSGTTVSVGASSDLVCTGLGSVVHVQSQIADDDTDWGQDCSSWWPWPWFTTSSWTYVGRNSCADWNSSSLQLTDPSPVYGTGSTSVAFTAESKPAPDHYYGPVPQWTVTGSAKFSHHAPAVSHPATSGGPVKIALSATPKPGSFTVDWAPLSLPGTTILKHQVQWRRTGTATWSSQSVNMPATSTTVNGLEGGKSYDIQVQAEDTYGIKLMRATTAITTEQLPDPTIPPPLPDPPGASPLPNPTTILGWKSGSVVLAPNGSVDFSATVSGDSRPVELQTRRQGAASWKTRATLTSVDNLVAGSYPVLPGINEWRLHAPEHGFSEPATTAVRTVSAASKITGFSTKKASVRKGKILKNTITVSPGAGRKVVVQYKLAGTKTWKRYRTVTASDTGRAVIKLKAFAGTRAWRATVARSADFGTATTTASRVVRGK
ncbi:fibronectin type III domain-containing protein [Nocardioides sp.]|uniref:fibronectin type III domain-containing protein n=1 Tax=Nocardioides sp. TaxID=35761 RepID=UPI00273443D2|nr:fibronectin type III domain-containing protein [Nocardioides sp.]MDP3892228.1 fibronectin type III domain-containing protein [Nocardioides sp.]